MKAHWLDKWEAQQENHEEEFNERAAIMQYDAGMTREEAEKKALHILKEKYPDSTAFIKEKAK